MKKLLLIIPLLFLSKLLVAQKQGVDSLVVHTKIYCDHCAECEDCMPHIERELRFTKVVESSKLDLSAQTITIYYASNKTNPAALRKAVANAGFDADDVLANPKAVARLDECCRKK
jgi:periplasmic mercuric ion binding protein